MYENIDTDEYYPKIFSNEGEGKVANQHHRFADPSDIVTSFLLPNTNKEVYSCNFYSQYVNSICLKYFNKQ